MKMGDGHHSSSSSHCKITTVTTGLSGLKSGVVSTALGIYHPAIKHGNGKSPMKKIGYK
jgi:hypothetical protein